MNYENADKEASKRQLAVLQELGVGVEGPISSPEANKLIKEHEGRWAVLPATPKQKGFLKKRGKWQEGTTRGQAAALIDEIKGKQDWLGERKARFTEWFRRDGS